MELVALSDHSGGGQRTQRSPSGMPSQSAREGAGRLVLSPPGAQPVGSSSLQKPRCDLCLSCGGTGLSQPRSRRRKSSLHSDHFRLLMEVSGSSASQGIGEGCLNDGYYGRFFEEMRILGRGGFGSVYLCRHVLDGLDLGLYACKKLPVGNSHEWLTKALNEVRSLEALKHPNIVDYKHSWLETSQMSEFSPAVPCLFIVMEYADCGNMSTLSTGPPLTDHQLLYYFSQLCFGLQHLHHQGILYHDLKPANILLKSVFDAVTGLSDIQVLLSDFGASAHKRELFERTGFSGTENFTAPEVLAGKGLCVPTFEAEQKADVWSAGAVLYTLAHGVEPESGSDYYSVEEQLRQHAIDSGEQLRLPVIYDLISTLMEPDPEKRPFVDQIFEHQAMKFSGGASTPTSTSRSCYARQAIESPGLTFTQPERKFRITASGPHLPRALALAAVSLVFCVLAYLLRSFHIQVYV